LNPNPRAKAALDDRVVGLDARYRVLPIQVSTVGLKVHGDLEP
jgi:hypothetical protein